MFKGFIDWLTTDPAKEVKTIKHVHQSNFRKYVLYRDTNNKELHRENFKTGAIIPSVGSTFVKKVFDPKAAYVVDVFYNFKADYEFDGTQDVAAVKITVRLV